MIKVVHILKNLFISKFLVQVVVRVGDGDGVGDKARVRVGFVPMKLSFDPHFELYPII